MKNLPQHPGHSVLFCIALMFAVMSSLAMRAAVTEAWVHRYNDTNNGIDIPSGVAVDQNGDVFVTGVALDGVRGFYTTKYAGPDGALLWEKRSSPTNRDDSALALTLDGSGDVIVAGFSNNRGEPFSFYPDYYLTKYASLDGALL